MLINVGGNPLTSRSQLLTTVACNASGQREYALEGSVFIAGAAVQWLRDGLGIIDSSSEVESLADDLEIGGSGVRAQACHIESGLVDDFCFKEEANALHVLNAPSPARGSSR